MFRSTRLLCVCLGLTVVGVGLRANTDIALSGQQWQINGKVTNPGSAAEGLLMNVRMVNATFEDRNQPDFNADANTAAFISRVPEYAAAGVNAFTLCLQGGSPGYEGAVNSAFNADGSLRPEYMRRIERVLRACDEHGVAVILSYYYQRQIGLLRDEAAIRAGVVNATRWVVDHGFKNVLIEVANEFAHGGFKDAPVIQTLAGQTSLLRLVKQTAPDLLVTASGYGQARLPAEVAAACDFLSPHWNVVPLADIPARIEALRRFGKPLVCTEDLRDTEADLLAALRASVAHGCAYGLMTHDANQTFPFRFQGPADNPAYYAALRELTARHPSVAVEPDSAGQCDACAVEAGPGPAVITVTGNIFQFEAEAGAGDWERITTPTGTAMRDPGHGQMSYELMFTQPGKYYIFLLAQQGEAGRGHGKENDTALTLGGEKLYGADGVTRPTGLRCSGDWQWAWRPKGPGTHTPPSIRDHSAYFLVTQPGRLRLEMQHRSTNFAVDRVLLKRDNPSPPQ